MAEINNLYLIGFVLLCSTAMIWVIYTFQALWIGALGWFFVVYLFACVCYWQAKYEKGIKIKVS